MENPILTQLEREVLTKAICAQIESLRNELEKLTLHAIELWVEPWNLSGYLYVMTDPENEELWDNAAWEFCEITINPDSSEEIESILNKFQEKMNTIEFSEESCTLVYSEIAEILCSEEVSILLQTFTLSEEFILRVMNPDSPVQYNYCDKVRNRETPLKERPVEDRMRLALVQSTVPRTLSDLLKIAELEYSQLTNREKHQIARIIVQHCEYPMKYNTISRYLNLDEKKGRAELSDLLAVTFILQESWRTNYQKWFKIE